MASTARAAVGALLLMVSSVPPTGASELVQAVIAVESVTGLHPLHVEVARSEEARLKGLMERTRLADDAGMLFVYDRMQPAQGGFWMYRTYLSLDIAFLDPQGTILALRTMAPCTFERDRCPVYRAGTPFRFALEVNGGYFAQHGVTVGDRVRLDSVFR